MKLPMTTAAAAAQGDLLMYHGCFHTRQPLQAISNETMVNKTLKP